MGINMTVGYRFGLATSEMGFYASATAMGDAGSDVSHTPNRHLL